jgi:hypothetical protein
VEIGVRKVVFLITLVLACVAAPQALAAAPVLVSAGSDGLLPTATWSLPPGVSAQIVEVATSPTVDSDGYFDSDSLVAGGLLSPSQTTWTDLFDLVTGATYYLHVGGTDSSCSSCPQIEFSRIISFKIDANAKGSQKIGLRVQTAGTGAGSVTSFPSGIDCGASCFQQYAKDGHVTLTPAPAPGSVFTGWTGGGCFGPSPTCEVTMNVGQTVIATFDLISPPTVPDLTVTRDTANATASFTVCDDSSGPLTIALVQIWQDKGQWKSATTTTTQDHISGCDTHTVNAPLAARAAPKLWVAVQVTDVDGRQGSLRTAPAP